MVTLPHVLIALALALNVECYLWCVRRRLKAEPRPTPQELVIVFVVVGVLWWAIDACRFAVWGLRNFVEWVAQPVAHHARARWAHRKLRRHTAEHATYYPTAGNVLTAASVRHYPVRALPPPPAVQAPVAQAPPEALALPAAARPVPVEPVSATPEEEWRVGPDGQINAVQLLPDGRRLVTPLMKGYS